MNEKRKISSWEEQYEEEQRKARFEEKLHAVITIVGVAVVVIVTVGVANYNGRQRQLEKTKVEAFPEEEILVGVDVGVNVGDTPKEAIPEPMNSDPKLDLPSDRGQENGHSDPNDSLSESLPKKKIYEIGEMKFYAEEGLTDEEVVEAEIESLKKTNDYRNRQILQQQYFIMSNERSVAKYEVELFKIKHEEMTEEEEKELGELTAKYEAKKAEFEQFVEENPDIEPTPPSPPSPKKKAPTPAPQP